MSDNGSRQLTKKETSSSSYMKNNSKQTKQQQPLFESVALDMAASNGGTGDNNSSSNFKKTDEEDQRKMTSSCSKTTKCLLIISMSLAIIITAILIAIFAFNMLDKEDQCLTLNQPFQTAGYKLFSTKTTYNLSYDELAESLVHKSNSPDVERAPDIFSKEHNLRSINEHLVSEKRCKVIQIQYYGRHAARFPNRNNIEEMLEVISHVQNLIDLSKFSSPPSQNNNTSSQQDQTNNLVTVTSTGNSTPADSVCSNPMTQYKHWESFMSIEQDNLVTDSGVSETSAIAKRLKEIYPQMFDAKQAEIILGTTHEVRTAQTVIPFLEHLDNFEIKDCPLSSFPKDGLSDKSKVSEIRNNECLKKVLNESFKERLQFHKKCDEIAKSKNRIQHISFGSDLKSLLNVTDPIAASISKKLKLDQEKYLSGRQAKELYDICTFETAVRGSSIWCNLFTDRELKLYEYVDDVKDFYEDAYWHEDQARSSCPITIEIINSFRRARKNPRNLETHLYFTHSQAIRKLIAATVDLSKDRAYSNESVRDFIHSLDVPDDRNWRTSFLTPFSANLQFTLYKCEPESNPSGEYINLDVDDHLKVVASLNEQPIVMTGCDSVICSYDKFRDSNNQNVKSHKCNLDDYCKFQYKIR